MYRNHEHPERCLSPTENKQQDKVIAYDYQHSAFKVSRRKLEKHPHLPTWISNTYGPLKSQTWNILFNKTISWNIQ